LYIEKFKLVTMNNIPDRLTTILNHYDLSAGAFADKLGIQKSSISHLLSGRNKPSFQFLSKLAKAFPEINLNWFITGQGQMLENALNDSISEKNNSVAFSANYPTEEIVEINKPETKKLSEENISKESSGEVENIIMVFDNDTFKILKKA